MQATLMAHRKASRQTNTTSSSSVSLKATLNAARKDVQEICKELVYTENTKRVCYLEHPPHMLHVSGTGESGGLLTDILHQGLSRLCHLSHLLAVSLSPLLLTHCV